MVFLLSPQGALSENFRNSYGFPKVPRREPLGENLKNSYGFLRSTPREPTETILLGNPTVVLR